VRVARGVRGCDDLQPENEKRDHGREMPGQP
jgi:hypothetical protein